MSDEDPPLVHDGLDPAPEPKPTIEKVSEAVRDTARRVGGAIDAGRKPGMPLRYPEQDCARGAARFAAGRVSARCSRRPPPVTGNGWMAQRADCRALNDTVVINGCVIRGRIPVPRCAFTT